MKTLLAAVVLLVALCAIDGAQAQSPANNARPVTADNFVRAESDTYLAALVKERGLGRFLHRREPSRIDHQTVIRTNRDTLYSSAG